MAYLIALLIMLATGSLVLGFYLLRQKSPVAVKVAEYSKNTAGVAKRSYFEIRIRPLSQKLSARFPKLKRWITPPDIEAKLAYAGEPLGIDVNLFFGMQLLACLVFAFVGFLLGAFWAKFTGMMLGALIGGGFGIYYPIMWLNGKAKQRQYEITIAMPDSLDLLATSMEAGLGFDIALQHVVARMRGPLAEEYARFLHELQMGIPRQECFRRLISRNSSEELRTVAGALLQAHELGTPSGKTLQDQSEDMRVRRIQRAKEEGAKASPKITLVTTIMVAPAVMGLFLAIVACKVVQNLGPLMKEFIGR